MARYDRPNVYGVSRDLWDHPMFADEPYTERQAWAWLVGAAAWKTINARGNAGAVKLHRGEFSFSIRFLAEKWQWKKDRVARYLSRLQKHDMVRDTERDGCQVYSICNYNKFQVVSLPKRDTEQDSQCDTNATAPRQRRDKEETGETGKTLNLASLGSALVAWCSLASDFPPWWPHPEWAEFMVLRKKLRAPLTPKAVANIVRDVSALRGEGHDPAAVFDQSVTRAWRGVFAIKAEHGTGPPRVPQAKILSILDKPPDEPCH